MSLKNGATQNRKGRSAKSSQTVHAGCHSEHKVLVSMALKRVKSDLDAFVFLQQG